MIGNMLFFSCDPDLWEKWFPIWRTDMKVQWVGTTNSYNTFPETNIFAPENGWLEDYFPIGMAYFQGLC